jgi:hypothetical protein
MLCLPLYVENETKRHDMVVERMGRLKEKYELVSHLWSLNETPFSKDVQAESRDLYERYRV